MTFVIVLNIVLIAAVFSAIVGMLATAIRTSSNSQPATSGRKSRAHAHGHRPIRARGYGSYEGLNA
jgi:hypothetical protein